MRKYIGLTAVLVGVISLTAGAPLWGQTPPSAPHAHKAPHGGEVVEIANHHVEFKADSLGAIAVWVLDAKQKTVAPPKGASVTLIGAAGAQVTLPLQIEVAAQQLVAHFDPAKFLRFQAVVSIPISGAKRNLRFRYPGHR